MPERLSPVDAAQEKEVESLICVAGVITYGATSFRRNVWMKSVWQSKRF